MAGLLLSPTLIWKDFSVPVGVEATILEKTVFEGLEYIDAYVFGREISGKKVKIYCKFVRPQNKKNLPQVVLLQDFKDGLNLNLATDLAKRGFGAVIVDLAGVEEGKTYYTVYPEEISYANLRRSNYLDCEIEVSANKTCWYEWSVAVRYVIEYLKESEKSPKIGIMALDAVATVLWQVAATCTDLSCAVAVKNAGWYAYRGINKFGETTDPQFSDDAVAFIAGIEPQSYSQHLKCPTLVLSPTNSPYYDCDRAYDTLSRVDESVYTAIQYSVNSRNSVDYKCYNNALIFLSEYLTGKKTEHNLPKEVVVLGRIEDKKLIVDVFPDTNGLKEVNLYVAEESVEPCYRTWRISSGEDKGRIKSKEGYAFEYIPYPESKFVAYFAEAVYKNGFRVCSIISAKKFESNEVEISNKFKILYASRILNTETAFAKAKENDVSPRGIDIIDSPVEVKKGAADLLGLHGAKGLLTFKINAKKYRPQDDAMLMLDVYSKEQGVMQVKLIADYFGDRKTEYIYTVKLTGADVWRNVKIENTRFKTVEGMPLKSYEKIQAIEFCSERDFLINNVIWV